MAIGRGNSDKAWRNKKEKKTSRAFYKSSRRPTIVTGGLIIYKKNTKYK